MNFRDFGGNEAYDAETNTSKKWTLDDARAGHMQRYNTKGDIWENNTDLPPIEEYRNTWYLQSIRDDKMSLIENHYHDSWDFYLPNVTEVSHEMYSQYIVHEWTG